MKLLIVTQAVDSEDPVLGFFVRWIVEFSKHFDRIEVICLKAGKYELPENVRVHSLGKERGESSSLVYAWRFLHLVWYFRRDYDVVFVHMNQEYILLAGWLWKFLRKPLYLWRNHYAGSFLTRTAGFFCRKVFYTSRHSYTAHFRNAVRMPVGVDIERFNPGDPLARVPRSILFLARMAPSKRPDLVLDALATLAREGVKFTADFVGSPLLQDVLFYERLKARAAPLGGAVRFVSSVPNAETIRLYQSHQIFVNASPSGMFDKTLFEAAACGCAVLATSEDWRALAGEQVHFDSSEQLASRLKETLGKGAERPLDTVVREHSLEALGLALSGIF